TFSGGLSALADMNIGSNSRWYQNGQSFMTSSTTAAGNLTFGYQTPGNINASGGLYNSYFGYQAGQSATSSVRNTGLGYQALKSVASGEGVSKGNDNTAIGYVALSNNTYGYQNTAIGSRALLVNTTGYQNVALGFNALSSNTSGYNNFGIGHYSLAAVTTGTGNVAIGVSALRATTASNNVGIGASALQSNTSGYQNTSIGATALYLNTTGYNVTGVGDHAMMYSTGINNTGFGQSVGMWLDNNLAQYRITTDTNMTLLGHNATKDNASQLDNGIAIGADARVLASNQAVFGNDNITTTLLKGKVGIGTTTPAWLLDIATTSAPQLALTDPNAGANLKHWTFRSSGGSLFFATSTDAYTTSSIAALTINSNGYIGVATTSPWRAFSVNGAVAMIGLSASQGNAVCIDANGEITNPGASACTGSSERFKEKIETLAPGFALDELSKLRVVSFDYKEGNYSAEDQKGSYGMIAEEVALVDDKLVDYGYDRQPLTLKFEKFIGLFVQAIQDLVARITGLEDKFAEQQAEIEALKARMNTLDGQTAAAITGEPLHCASPKVLSDDGKSCINAPVEKTLSCTSPDVPNADGTSCVAPELKCADDEVPTDGKCVKTAPVIALVGEPSISWSLNVKYADPGAVAKDYSGAEISPVIINSAAVDIATAGSYAVTYNITDSAGHKAAEVTRTVIVTAE
ncbi:MAG: immunoglobulin-like domain-containing protein, partial [Candidatus Paceibacterota bacterium]